MTDVWGVRNDTLAREELLSGLIAIGWDETLRDLSRLSRVDVRRLVRDTWPDASPRSVGNIVGQLVRFASEMTVGDLVLAPVRGSTRIDIGRVAGEYRYEVGAEVHRHRRDVEWLATDVPRRSLPDRAQTALRAQMTVFHIKGAADVEEFLARPRTEVMSADDLRELLAQAAAGIESEAGVHPQEYVDVASASDPLAGLRAMVSAGPASKTFVQLAKIGRIDLSFESIVVEAGERIGLAPAEVAQARGRIDFWLA